MNFREENRYDKAGRLTHAWHKNGIIEHRQHDALSQLTRRFHQPARPAGCIRFTHYVQNAYKPSPFFTAINIGTALQPAVIGSHSYTLDTAGRRTAHNNTGTNVNYTYDNADQVTGSTGDIARSYAYDAAGNRTSANQFGQTISYNANALNQYTSLTGSAAPTYDANGNTLTMSGSTFTYDQKNQLKSISGLDSNSQPVTITYSYDAMSRRIAKSTSTQTTLYAYDGWNVVEEYQLQNSSFILQTLYTWGLDLSGTSQGSGGVGGLLYTEDLVTNTAWHHHYDGNGNVTHLSNAAAQAVAIYTYDAFGNTVTATGSYAAANTYRFSTKPLDAEITNTPLYYYGYRFYTPLTGRWINRDPIEESGGVNLYGFVGNDGINRWDILGLDWILYSGQKLVLYKGDYPIKKEMICEYRAYSGNLGLQTKEHTDKKDSGPTPEGAYQINLVPDPDRKAPIIDGDLVKPNPDGGISRLPVKEDGSPVLAAWGTQRARLDPMDSTDTKDRHSFYIHDSAKQYTSGCVECSDKTLFDRLREYRTNGYKNIRVQIEYTDATTGLEKVEYITSPSETPSPPPRYTPRPAPPSIRPQGGI